MRLLISFMLFTLFTSVVLTAQIDSYPIKDYKRPELHRKTLLINGAANSSNSFISNSDNDRSTLNLNLSQYYRGFRNDERTQRTTSHRTTIDTDVDFEAINKVKSLITHSSQLDIKRFKPNRTFAGFSPKIEFISAYDKGEENLTRNANLSLPVGLGVGRIEIINDAWLAISILKNLREEGQLLREPTHEEITAFAEEIARIKNARVLDFRRKRIYELDEIYKYIINLELVTENTFAFATLYDAWVFEIFDTRRSGSSAESYFSPEYRVNIQNDQFDSGRGEWLLKYRSYKPINIHWDLNSSFEIKFNSNYSTNPNLLEEKQQIKDNMMLTMGTEYGVDYYLSRRTYFGLQSSLSFNKMFKTSTENYFVSTRFNFVHWLSSQLLVVGNISISNQYIDNLFFQSNRFNPSFNINLQYSVF